MAKVPFGNRKAKVLANLGGSDRLDLIAEGMPIILDSADGFWTAAAALGGNREARVHWARAHPWKVRRWRWSPARGLRQCGRRGRISRGEDAIVRSRAQATAALRRSSPAGTGWPGPPDP